MCIASKSICYTANFCLKLLAATVVAAIVAAVEEKKETEKETTGYLLQKQLFERLWVRTPT